MVIQVLINLFIGRQDPLDPIAGDIDDIQLVPDTDSNKTSNGHTYVTPSSTTSAHLPTPSRLGNTSAYYEYNLEAAGPPKDTSTSLKQLVLKSGEYFQPIWTATINSKGDNAESSTSWIEIVESGLKDRCAVQYALQRV